MALANQIIPFNEHSSAIVAPNIPTAGMIDSMYKLAQIACKSGMTKASKEQDAFFIIMYGYELGISPMTALRTIYSVNGTPTCSGEAMLALIRKSGKVEVTLPDIDRVKAEGKSSVTMKRRDTGESYTATFTLKEAENAKLTNNATWRNYPAWMLTWRCVSNAAKFLCSDIIGGLYTLDEIAPQTPLDENGAPTGDIIQGELVGDEKPKWNTPEKIDLLFGTMLQNGLSESETLRLANIPDKYSDKWGDFESGKAAGLAIMAALEAEVEREKQQVEPIEPERPPGWEDLKEVFPNDVVPTADNKKARKEKAASKTMEERIKEGGWVKAILRSVEVKEYTNKANELQLRLQFNAELENGQFVKAGLFDTNLLIETKWMIETEMVKGKVVTFYDQLDALVKQDGKFWNVMEESIHRNPSAKFEDAFEEYSLPSNWQEQTDRF